MSKIQKIILSSLLTIGFISLAWTASAVLAQTTDSLDLGTSYASSTGLTAKDPRLVVANIIKIALGFIGSIGVILVIYAGFLWMTAAGSSEKIDKAKMILKNSAIGLVLVLSAYAITSFVINSILGATNGGQNGGGGTTNPDLPPGPITARILRIDGTVPINYSEGLPRNTQIRFHFNYPVNPNAVNDGNIKVDSKDGVVKGEWQVNGREIYFEPDKKCKGECGEVNCLPGDSKIRVEMAGMKPADDSIKSLDCSDGSCELVFTTIDAIDCKDPTIISFKSESGFCAGVSKGMKAHAADDYRLASFEFFANNESISYQSSGDYGKEWATDTSWAASGQAGDTYNLKVRVLDVVGRDQEKTLSGKLLPAHCCNGTKDEDETGIDCGGSCLRCQGAACASDLMSPSASCDNNLCGSGFCTQQGSSAAACSAAGYNTGVSACCLCQEKPTISGISPRGGFCQSQVDKFCLTSEDCAEGDSCNQITPNAKAGNLVTIMGSGFGTATGTVKFSNNKLGDLSACGIDAWADDQIVVKVPAGTISGKVEVTNSSNFTAVSSEDLVLNNISRPGLCSLSKASGTTDELIDYSGLNFSVSGTTTKAFYGNFYDPIPANEQQAVSETLVKGKVPSLQNGRVSTFVRQEASGKPGPSSNLLLFDKVVDPRTLPRISSFDPISGPAGQYVTIYGQGFGNVRGQSQVFFGNKEADYHFPTECANSTWSNNQVIIKVPSGASTGVISIKLADGTTIDASSQFTVNTDPLQPSICKISPTIARAGTPIQVWGEYFREYNSDSSRIRFSQNINATTTNWFYGTNGYSSATSTLPAQSVSGPVRLVNNTGASNGLNLQVGSCQADSDCQGQICCPASSPNSGQCKNSPADCYGSLASCTYGWSFTTTDSSDTNCSNGSQPCNGVCCEDGEECQNNICVKHEFLSCNNYHQCNGAMYCPNSPGWCSQKAGSTEVSDCTNQYCEEFFKSQEIVAGKPVYYEKGNICIDGNAKCNLDRNVSFDMAGNQVGYQLSCQAVDDKSFWTTHLTAGQCPTKTIEYGEWQLTTNKICVSNKSCQTCSDKLSCLDIGKDDGLCGLPDKVCAAGSRCSDGKCKKETGSCECCCDINLNNEGNGNNPGCCAPLTCAGTCGSGTSDDGKKFGYCSGCKDAGSTQAEQDSACNCSGSVGKYCDTTVGNGACRDCSQITDIHQCVKSTSCCYDAKNNQCRGVGTGVKIADGKDAGYCGYYSCSGLKCSDTLSRNGVYATRSQCQQKCSVVSYQGESCNLAGTSTGCGYQLCASPLSCRTASGESSTSTNQADCGTCCCDPANDKCGLLNPALTCLPNMGNCSGEGRGLCCGCSKDSECGNTNGSGCGYSTCCQSRPRPRTVYPAVGSDSICRNSEISVEFNQPMDPNSLKDNVLLIADYDDKVCPAGTRYLAKNQTKTNWLAKLQQRFVAWFGPRLTIAAPDARHNYCLVSSDARVENNKIKVNLNNSLDKDRLYYLAIITDSDIEDGKRNGAVSLTGVGLNNSLVEGSGLVSGDGWSFGNLDIKKGIYSYFKTGDRICQVNTVEINPKSVLLSDLQASQNLTAGAYYTFNVGQNIVNTPLATTSDYSWSWNWNIANSAVAELTDINNNRANVKPKNNKDADTYVSATAIINTDKTGGNTVGQSISGSSVIKVFLCANPWPARKIDGSWDPWVDYATNMQLYYCRDNEDKEAINSDLPGLKYVSSTDSNSPNNKAFYFFRYGSINTAPA
ncbi:MAG TPA: IPT/TIG domain-containing protein, partial [bacterium]|nr:IPT/TIG domain-containing protein [bacterium]